MSLEGENRTLSKRWEADRSVTTHAGERHFGDGASVSLLFDSVHPVRDVLFIRGSDDRNLRTSRGGAPRWGLERIAKARAETGLS